ncbi:MAG: hypothetical protein RMN25_09225 [Anaerolineae bacterium]|nr:hypothetical protein [Thermoflexales bacterium]MDW8407950.1 hypothetical protein [Anaerolineae bacterium]
MNITQTSSQRKWLYPLIYFLLIVIAFLPLITERPYNPQNTSAVIFEILSRATAPYAGWGWIFRALTLLVVGLAVWKPDVGSRLVAAYFGLNYLLVAAIQTHAETPAYGYAVHTGALVADVLLGLLWLGVAWKDGLRLDWQAIPRARWLLLPFALLVFWSPIAYQGGRFIFDVNPLLLLTSPDYGLAYCFLTPVFVFLLILAWPRVDAFAFRITAFNGLIYGLFNLAAWADPATWMMGIMHVPLLVISIAALWMARSQPQSRAAHA